MKNINLKLNKTKLVARLMLVVILVGVMSLVSCHTHGDGCIWVEVSGDFDSFKDTQAFIQESIDKYGYNIIAFDLDNEPSVTNTNYNVLLESRSSYPYISATFYLLKNEVKIEIDYLFLSLDSNFDDDVKFEIKLVEIIDYSDLYKDSTYQMGLIYNLYCNDQNIAEMEFLVSLLEDGNYEEYYSDICDMLLENLVVIK